MPVSGRIFQDDNRNGRDDAEGGHAFVRAEADGYCGWLAETALGPAVRATRAQADRALWLHGVSPHVDRKLDAGEIRAMKLILDDLAFRLGQWCRVDDPQPRQEAAAPLGGDRRSAAEVPGRCRLLRAALRAEHGARLRPRGALPVV